MDPIFTLTRRNKVPIITFPKPVGVGGKVRILLQFDEHWDNPHSDQDMIERQMKDAHSQGLPIFKGGDTFCAMQGRYDRRRARTDIRPEHDTPYYLDALVNGYAKFASPYASSIACMGRGNHELSILKNCETDLIERTAEQLRQAGGNIEVMGIGGWLMVQVYVTKTVKLLYRIAFHHGHGGGGIITKGVIQASRRAMIYPDANAVITGHVHENWRVSFCRDRCTPTGRIYQDEQIHICSPTYKNEYDPSSSGWHNLRGGPPKPLGGTWLELTTARLYDGMTRKNATDKSQTPLYHLIADATQAK